MAKEIAFANTIGLMI